MVEPAGQEPRVDVEATESRLDELERDNRAMRREVLEARHSLLVNRDHVVGTEAEIGRLNRDILRMQQELITARKRIRGLQKDKSGLVRRNQDLRAKLGAARSRNQSLQAELDRERAVRVPLSRKIVRRLRSGRR
jgi:chromosome segregation ATPase